MPQANGFCLDCFVSVVVVALVGIVACACLGSSWSTAFTALAGPLLEGHSLSWRSAPSGALSPACGRLAAQDASRTDGELLPANALLAKVVAVAADVASTCPSRVAAALEDGLCVAFSLLLVVPGGREWN